MNEIACHDAAIQAIVCGGYSVEMLREPHRFRLRIAGVMVQVFSVRRGEWSIPDAYRPAAEDTKAAIFIDYSSGDADYYVVPADWLREHTARHEQTNRIEHDGIRPRNDESLHMAIRPSKISQWRDRWVVLAELQ